MSHIRSKDMMLQFAPISSLLWESFSYRLVSLKYCLFTIRIAVVRDTEVSLIKFWGKNGGFFWF